MVERSIILFYGHVSYGGTQIVGGVTLYSHLSDITCCHKAILSQTESSLGLFCSLSILLSKYTLQIKMKMYLISEITIKMLTKIKMEDKQ